jgi:hypothetical protein
MISPHSPHFIRDCIGTAFPNERIVGAQVLSGGLINTMNATWSIATLEIEIFSSIA